MGEAQSKYTIDAFKQKFPGKPIKYLILTHHHMDHTGGMRTYAAEGATIVVPAPDKAYFEKDLKTTHTVVPDAYQKNPKKGQVVEVKDQMSLKDADGNEIKLTRIDNPHVDGMLLGHVVKDNVVWVTDLYSPGRDTAKNPGSEAVAAAVKKLGISGATFGGGHGANGPQSGLEAIMAQK
jgi:glyoxylase-like metal-dependent hydrolase (beta-lactamase superfamily II)